MRVIYIFSLPLVEIDEPCRHEIQFGGMCANCGKDMTEYVVEITLRICIVIGC